VIELFLSEQLFPFGIAKGRERMVGPRRLMAEEATRESQGQIRVALDRLAEEAGRYEGRLERLTDALRPALLPRPPQEVGVEKNSVRRESSAIAGMLDEITSRIARCTDELHALTELIDI
jgi:hypothetical protein